MRMNIRQLDEILSKLKDISVLVLGDYFLDKYLLIDPDLDENPLKQVFPLIRLYQRNYVLVLRVQLPII
jgi:hypothetical protein